MKHPAADRCLEGLILARLHLYGIEQALQGFEDGDPSFDMAGTLDAVNERLEAARRGLFTQEGATK